MFHLMSPRLLVCRISWMDHYRGVAGGDRATGGGAWVKEHGFGHEAFNFQRFVGVYYGNVQPVGKGINLTKLGGNADDGSLGGVTVAWVATHPTEGGTRVVGWYRDATVFARVQKAPPGAARRLPDGSRAGFLTRSKVGHLLQRDERVLEVPRGKGGMGQANVWYPDRTAAAPILRYIHAGGEPRPLEGGSRLPRLTNVEKKLRIERTAITATAKWFTERGYDVRDVSMDRVGWDLEASRGRSRLRLEVKGTSRGHEDFDVEVTPNEYAQMGEHRASYRLCVVTDCESTARVWIFAWSTETGTWSSTDGRRQLEVEEVVAARFRLAD